MTLRKTRRIHLEGLLALLVCFAAPGAMGATSLGDETLSVDEDYAVQNVDLSTKFSTSGGVFYSLVGSTGASVGTATVGGLSGAVQITAVADANGSQTFEFRANDSGPPDSYFLTLDVAPVNDAPSFTKGADQSVAEDSGAQTVSGWATSMSAGPADESGQTLNFNVSSDNPGLFSAAPAIDGTSGDLTFMPAADANGSATVTVSVSDDGGTASGGVDTSPDQTFTITVTGVNDAPSFTKGADVTVDEDAGAQTVSGWATSMSAGPADESGQTLNFNVSSDNPGLFSAAPAIDGTTGDLTFTPAADGNGSATVTVSVSDDGGTASGGVDTSPDQTFTITVTGVNDAPSFTKGADVVVNEDATPQTVSGWATSMIAGPPDESGQNLNFNVSSDNPGLFAAGPAIDPISGDLTFTPVADANGAATVTVSVTDDGGTSGGGVDTSPDQTFTISVGQVNDAPAFNAGSDQSVTEDAGPVTVAGWATGLSPGPADESGQTLTFDVVGNSAPGLFSAAPAVDGTSGDLTFTTAADANGTATITLVVRDSGGTAGGGADTSAPQSFDIVVDPVNDLPIFTPGATVSAAEDAGPTSISPWATGISAGPADEAAQVLTFNVVGNSNPGLFATAPAIDPTTGDLTFETAFDANGSATLVVNLSDDGGTANGGEDTTADETFDIVISSVNDDPAPADDTATMDEDSGSILIPVMANDYLGEGPTTLTTAGAGGKSEGAHQVLLDGNGDPVDQANADVEIVGNQVQYTPRDDFFGTDTFTYTITDSDGDTGTGTVTVTVNPINDAPEGQSLRTFTLEANSVLDVDAANGLLLGAYDLEGAVVGSDGEPVGSNLTIQVAAFPPQGTMSLDNLDGSFSYMPPVDFVGDVSMFYWISDGDRRSPLYEARFTVYAAPEPPPPPAPGEVAVDWNLANVPLEQSTSVAPNVIVMMDDSGSMDWNVSISGEDENGGFLIRNDDIATSSRRSTSYYYLWDLYDNIFGWSNINGRILPTEEELDSHSSTDNNHYGVWRARNAGYNRLYYNPQVHYTPWTGEDAVNQPFGNADPSAIRLDPRNPSVTFDMLSSHSYYADNVPQWDSNGGSDNYQHVSGLYIPRYYTTTATGPLAWDDPHALVEIRAGNAPFVGGPDREDCAADDGDPTTCTYAQEIQNFANFFQYYRKREYAAKNGLGKVVADVQDIRIGYETINDHRSARVSDMNDLYTEGNKKSLLDEIYRTNSSGGTPLRRALDRAGDLFAGNGSYDPVLPEPEGQCEQNFTLLFSDGYWNGYDPSQDNEDGDDSSAFDGGRYADDEKETLADVAMYFYERDLRSLDDLVPVSQRDRLGAPAGTFSGGAARMHQHMKTYTVAFGVVGDVDPDSIPADPTTPFAWPDPESSPQGKIDDMLHAAVNGRGQFLSAVNPQELQTALEAAFLEFTQAASSTSAAAFNSTSLQAETLLYRGFYDLRDFSGELSATPLNSDGTLASSPLWQASQLLGPPGKLPDDRVIVTFDRSSNAGIPFRYADLKPEQKLFMDADEVAYIRGERGAEQPGGSLRARGSSGSLLGDIVNSSPVFVGAPLGLDRDQAPFPEDDLYSDFAAAHEDRDKMVYVGANDGILHGFDAQTGEERFGYVPNKILDGSQRFHSDLDEFSSPFYQHDYYVDLTPQISDAYMQGSWKTVLVGGLGGGGKGFFALDVTNPSSEFSSESSASGSVLWEFTDEDDTSPNGNTDPDGQPVKDLGYALSLPTVAMSNVESGGNKEWVAIFGNGPNSTSGIAKLFVLFMDRGTDGWDAGDFVKLDTGRGVPLPPDPLAGYPNGLGTPALVDVDLNGTVDWVYAGDRLGNLYRFDLCNRPAPTSDCATSSTGWTVTRLFTATYDGGSGETRQPILSQPLVIKHPDGGFLVIFGTGSYMTREDADSEDVQSVYAIWDRGSTNPPTAMDNAKADLLVQQTITNVVDDTVSPAQTRRIVSKNPVEYASGSSGTYGWYVDLDMQRATTTTSGGSNSDTSGNAPPAPQFPGEKAIRRFVLRNGSIATTTVLPSLDQFSCYGTRPGAILLFDALTGGDAAMEDPERAILDFNNDGEINQGDMVEYGGEQFAGGLLFNQSDLDGALVDLSTLGGTDSDQNDFLFACGGNDCVPFRIESPADNRSGRLSWRELDINNN